MPLGIVRVTDRLEPPTAGTYDAHVVKNLGNLVSVAWLPVRPKSFHLTFDNGCTEWSGDLEQTSAGLRGGAVLGDDTGKRRSAGVSSPPVACDP